MTVLFVNLGLKEKTLLAAAVYDEAMKEMHKVMVAVQESVYEYEGSINKFLMDDKGSTLVAVYGLPPVGHADDPTRGVLAALRYMMVIYWGHDQRPLFSYFDILFIDFPAFYGWESMKIDGK